jgi:predicted O-linked N-acetylglucosamine transferase (SPINDLY family)
VHLGDLLRDLGELVRAEASYREALALAPDSSAARAGLGLILKMTGRLEEAEACYLDGLETQPSSKTLRYGLGNVLYELGKIDDAADAFARSMQVDPEFAEARWSLGVSRMLARAREREEAEAHAELRELGGWLRSRRLSNWAAPVGALQPFYLAYRETNGRALLGEHGALCCELMHRWQEQERLRQPTRARRAVMRVGIISAHVHDHSVWSALVKGWVSGLDRSRFEISLFHLGPQQDAQTEFARANVAHFETGARPLRRWAEAIGARQPDVLIYPEIGIDPTTLQLAALRLAPLQLAAWGHPQTSGLPTIDGYLSAQALEPPEAQAHYTERLIALPNLGCCYHAAAPQKAEMDPAALGIDPDAPLLLCPGTPFKYDPEHDALFPEIARRAPGARLVFFRHTPPSMSQALESRLRVAFARAGFDYERSVAFVPVLPRPAYYGLMRRSAALLDTIGFSGFNTAMQAVECGLPIVAYEGKFMRGRFASGILRQMHMDDWVAGDSARFVELAAQLANDGEKRREARARIEAARAPLFDDPAPVRALESVLVRERG